jgi:ABC-type polysaccharide/polyol phosphate export permease
MTALQADARRYLIGIWQCRYFWLNLVRMDLRLRYRRSALGLAWSLLNPLMMTGILCFVFSAMFHQEIAEYAPFLLVGLAFWNFIASSVNHGCHCLHIGEQYIRQFPAPMAVYPLRTVLGAMFHFLLALGVAILLTWGFKGTSNVYALWSLLPAVVLLAITGWALAVVVSFGNAYLPDTAQLCEVGLQFAFYLTPIIYTPAAAQASGKKIPGMEAALACNPFAWLVRLLREPILHGHPPSMLTFGIAALFTA